MDHPTRLGRFKLLKKIATGGLSEVYLARPQDEDNTGAEVVVKRIIGNAIQDKAVLDLVKRGAEVASTLEHPHVARVLDLVQPASGEPYMVLEYVWGEDLRRLAERGMTAGRFMPLPLAVQVIAEVADALSYIHEKRDVSGAHLGLVHGEVSPANIMLGFHGEVKLLDFGVVEAERKAFEGAGQNQLKAKYPYMSPEQVEGVAVDLRSDLFSLGVVLYEFTTKKRLFKGGDVPSTMKAVAECDVKPPSESIPSYPPGLERIVLRALAKSPDARYANALQMRDDLLAFLSSEKQTPQVAERVTYMRSVFPDKLAETEAMMGVGYTGPRADALSHAKAAVAGATVGVRTSTSPGRPGLPPLPVKGGSGIMPAPPRPAIPPPPSSGIHAAAPRPPEGASGVHAGPSGLHAGPSGVHAGPSGVHAGPSGVHQPELEATTRLAATGPIEEEAPALPEIEATTRLPAHEVAPPPAPHVASHPSGVYDGLPQFGGSAASLAESPYADGEMGDDFRPPGGGGGPSSYDSPPSYRPAPPPTKAPASPVSVAVHTLRKAHLDEFQKDIDASRKWKVMAFLLVVGAIISLGWYALNDYEWPWEGATAEETPEPEPPAPVLPATIQATVETTPPGAAIAVNGIISAQRTPSQFEFVPNMTNTVAAYMDGYETQIIDVLMGASATAPVTLALVEIVQPPDWTPPEPDPESDAPIITEWTRPRGRLNVTTDPPGATILLNGRDVCVSPCEFDTDAEQEQNVTARLEGHYDTVANTVVPTMDEPRDVYYLELNIRPIPEHLYQRRCNLQIRTFPETLMVNVDDVEEGRATPLHVRWRVEEAHRVEIVAPPNFYPWERTFYPSAGYFYVTAILKRIPHDPAQYSVAIDLPVDMWGTNIYIEPNQIGTDEVVAYEIDEGSYHLILSWSPAYGAEGARRRTDFDIVLPAGMHVTEHYTWNPNTLAFELDDRSVGPYLSEEERADLEEDRVRRFERRERDRERLLRELEESRQEQEN